MIWGGLLLGLLGSLHCLAMCGPILWTLNQRHRQSLRGQLIYHGGRIFTYVILGVLAGVLGISLRWTLGQQFLSIATGLLIILGLVISSRWYTGILNKPLVWLKLRMGNDLAMSPNKQLWLGALNGLLPCGLTYVALATAISSGSMVSGALFMGLFGLGTLPMLIMITTGSFYFPKRWNSKLVLKVVTAFLGMLLIIRGLGLGVPYLSPKFALSSDEITICQ